MTAKGEAVREALDELFSDTSVEKQVTLDDLSELQSDIETKVDSLEADIKHEQKNK
jgi:predicted  nucleic acid-binding Zn ribbon protein